MTHSKQDMTKYLIRSVIALLFINFILMFLPFIKVYQPSYSQTNMFGVTTYKEWYTESASMIKFIFPIFLTGIPYLFSIISLAISIKKKNCKNIFFKIKNNTLNKPVKFFWLKFGAIANVFSMWIAHSQIKSMVKMYDEYGAYCNITFFGIVNIICTLAFIVVLFVLSHKTKAMFALVNKSQMAAEAIQQNQVKEIE